MTETTGSIAVQALLIEKEDGWIAQCLEYDIVAQAQTFTGVNQELERILVSHIAVSLELGRTPFAGFKPAPRRFWDAFERTRTRIESGIGVDGELAASGAPHLSSHLRVIHSRELAPA
jgi:hypothetical protein